MTCHFFWYTFLKRKSSYLIPVHGGWDNWSNFGTCSKTCGPGKETRTRTCNNPVPAHGGDECDGDKIEEKNCEIVIPCPPGKYRYTI